MNAVAFGHQGTLIFGVIGEQRGPNATIDSLTVTAELQGLRASKDVHDIDGWSALLSFFEELALNWRGRDGDKTFDSLEGDFQLSAKHDGHIRISFELEQFERPTTWAAKGELTLDPGEELTAALDALRDLLATRKS